MRLVILAGLVAALAGCPHDWERVTLHDGAVGDGSDVTSDVNLDVAVEAAPDVAIDVVGDRSLVDQSDAAEADVPCTMVCSGQCVDTNTDPSHCGQCSTVCPVHAYSDATCVAGVCGYQCHPGFVPFAGACFIAHADLRAPISTAITVSDRPTLRWAVQSGTEPGGTVTVTVCADPACTRPEVTADVVGASSWTVGSTGTTTVLPPGPHFWHAVVRGDGATGTPSPTWEFFVGGTSTGEGISGFAPDINRDGQTDLIVGSPDSAGGGSVFVYLNSGTAIATATPTELHPTGLDSSPGSPFGASVAALGDIDGDGFGDFGVGQPCATGCTATSITNAWVYFGQAAAPGYRPTPFTSHVLGTSGFGRVISAAGDLDGDGFGDFAVGAPSQGASSAGRVSIYLGSTGTPGFFGSASANIDLGRDGEQLGTSIAGAGDTDGDGRPELLVGAPGATTSAMAAGTAYLFQYAPGATPPYTVVTAARGTVVNEHLGQSVAFVGDVNRDTLIDFATGSPGVGSVQLFAGHRTATAPPTLLATATASADGSFGAAIASSGDFDGDGIAELAVGDAPARHVTVFHYDGTGLVPEQIIAGATAGFGTAIAQAGYLDGDRFADLAIGDTAAHAFVVLGRMTGTSTPTMLPNPGAATHTGFGRTLAIRAVRPRHGVWLLASDAW